MTTNGNPLIPWANTIESWASNTEMPPAIPQKGGKNFSVILFETSISISLSKVSKKNLGLLN